MFLKSYMNNLPQDMTFPAKICFAECLDMDNDVKLHETIVSLNFDLVILDVFPVSACLLFIALKYNLQYVLNAHLIQMDLMSTPALPSFSPSFYHEFSDDMSFKERLVNTYYTLTNNHPSFHELIAWEDVELLAKYNKDPSITSWMEVGRRADLFLIGMGPVLEYALPLNPNVINLECLTCRPANPLPDSLTAMIDPAPGMIVVSFGSLIDTLPDHLAEVFLKAFAQRKEIVFWRFRGKLPGNVPSNVNVMKWLPQNDLVGHPKAKLFITHSGNNGQYESIYHGIPMLAFPIFADQFHNAHRIDFHRYGLKAELRSITTEQLLQKISTIIDDPIYMNRTQRASRILKSRPMDSRQTAAFWIEHVMEFGGGHLRNKAVTMPWYSYFMIDVLLLLQAVLILTAIGVIFLVKFALKLCNGSDGHLQK